MDYLKVDEVAKDWGISPRRLQILCAEGKIQGATRFGRAWMIPGDTRKPADGRTREGRQARMQQQSDGQPMPRKTPFLHMTDLYSTPGSAEQAIEALAENQEAQTLLAAEIAYSRGEIDRVYAHAGYLLEKHSGFYATLSAGMLLALCAIWRGDLLMWNKAKIHIAEAPAETDIDRDIAVFALTATDSMLYDVTSFPEWFKIGCFDPLPRDSLPAAKVFFAKYLYAAAYAVATREHKINGIQGISLMSMVPFTLEPMISQAKADRSIIAEAYLRLTCAVVYHNCGRTDQAIRHIDRAISLALPDRLYGLLAEYCRTLGSLLEQRLVWVEPAAWEQVHRLYLVYNQGWSKLSGAVRGRNIFTGFSPREREVAKLAAFGMKNSEIAEHLHMSVSAVKQTITRVMQKTGISRDEFATIL